MEIRAKETNIRRALAIINPAYDNNLLFVQDFWTRGRFVCGVRLRTRKGGQLGSRRNQRGRRSIFASWEVYRDFMKVLFVLDPNTVIHSQVATYRSIADFADTYPTTAGHHFGTHATVHP